MYLEDEVRDYGFDQPDVTFYGMTVDSESIDIRKDRSWFSTEENESDYEVSYSVLKDGEEFIKFPKEVDKSTIHMFLLTQFQFDKEATKDIMMSIHIMEQEARMGA